MTHYTQLPPHEQQRFMADIKEYATHGMLRINRLSQHFEMPLMQRGMTFIEIYGSSEEWLNEVRTTGNYLTNVPQLKEIINSIVDGSLAPQAIGTYTPHRGRPTKTEQAIRKAQQEQQRKESEATSLFAQANTSPMCPPNIGRDTAPSAPLSSEGKNAASSLSSDQSLETATVSSGVSAGAPSIPILNSLPTGEGWGTSPHLDQLAFLLTPDLAKQVTNGYVRALRRQFEDAYTQAKHLALQGKESEAAEEAQRAHDLNAQIEAIYEQVDNEMAEAYIRLKEDDPYIAIITAKVKDIKDIIALCRPYHKKVTDADPTFTATVRAKIKENAPEAVAAREAEKQRKRDAAAIIKYLRRTDKPNTEKRIATMRKKLDELHLLIGAEADAYEPLLTKAIEDSKK